MSITPRFESAYRIFSRQLKLRRSLLLQRYTRRFCSEAALDAELNLYDIESAVLAKESELQDLHQALLSFAQKRLTGDKVPSNIEIFNPSISPFAVDFEAEEEEESEEEEEEYVNPLESEESEFERTLRVEVSNLQPWITTTKFVANLHQKCEQPLTKIEIETARQAYSKWAQKQESKGIRVFSKRPETVRDRVECFMKQKVSEDASKRDIIVERFLIDDLLHLYNSKYIPETILRSCQEVVQIETTDIGERYMRLNPPPTDMKREKMTKGNVLDACFRDEEVNDDGTFLLSNLSARFVKNLKVVPESEDILEEIHNLGFYSKRLQNGDYLVSPESFRKDVTSELEKKKPSEPVFYRVWWLLQSHSGKGMSTQTIKSEYESTYGEQLHVKYLTLKQFRPFLVCHPGEIPMFTARSPQDITRFSVQLRFASKRTYLKNFEKTLSQYADVTYMFFDQDANAMNVFFRHPIGATKCLAEKMIVHDGVRLRAHPYHPPSGLPKETPFQAVSSPPPRNNTLANDPPSNHPPVPAAGGMWVWVPGDTSPKYLETQGQTVEVEKEKSYDTLLEAIISILSEPKSSKKIFDDLKTSSDGLKHLKTSKIRNPRELKFQLLTSHCRDFGFESEKDCFRIRKNTLPREGPDVDVDRDLKLLLTKSCPIKLSELSNRFVREFGYLPDFTNFTPRLKQLFFQMKPEKGDWMVCETTSFRIPSHGLLARGFPETKGKNIARTFKDTLGLHVKAVPERKRKDCYRLYFQSKEDLKMVTEDLRENLESVGITLAWGQKKHPSNDVLENVES